MRLLSAKAPTRKTNRGERTALMAGERNRAWRRPT